jgi:hypothetical protein
MARITRALAIGAFIFSGLHAQDKNLTEVNVSLPERAISLGEPTVLVLSATNRGSVAAALDLGLNREGVFRLTITAPDGAASQVHPPPFRGSEIIVRGSNAVIEPGSTYNQTLRLSEWYAFSRIGTYVLSVDLVSPSFPLKKNFFALVVKERNPDRLREACERLTTTVVDAPYSSAARDATLELGLISDPIAIPYLERVLTASPPFRGAAIDGLGKIGTLESAEILIRVRNGSDEEDRSRASESLMVMAHATRDARLLDRLALAGITVR